MAGILQQSYDHENRKEQWATRLFILCLSVFGKFQGELRSAETLENGYKSYGSAFLSGFYPIVEWLWNKHNKRWSAQGFLSL